MAKNYSEKLKDPRWQKKRLEIFERDGWECRFCGDKRQSLTVHHRRYLPNTEPWDYPMELLVTLCLHCHEREYLYRSETEARLINALRDYFFVYEIEELANGFEQIKTQFGPSSISMIVSHLLFDGVSQRFVLKRLNQFIDRIAKKGPPTLDGKELNG
jgi:hypothetical protein